MIFYQYHDAIIHAWLRPSSGAFQTKVLQFVLIMCSLNYRFLIIGRNRSCGEKLHKYSSLWNAVACLHSSRRSRPVALVISPCRPSGTRSTRSTAWRCCGVGSHARRSRSASSSSASPTTRSRVTPSRCTPATTSTPTAWSAKWRRWARRTAAPSSTRRSATSTRSACASCRRRRPASTASSPRSSRCRCRRGSGPTSVRLPLSF